MDRLRTFCHISDYGAAGYENLHRLVASSSPLILWSPSAEMIERHSSLSVNEVVALIRNRKIVVTGREHWIFNIDARHKQAQVWDGAKWRKDFDGEIMGMFEEEERAGTPSEERRVVLAPKAAGDSTAAAYLGSNKYRIDKVFGLIRDKKLPAGQLERVERQIGTLDRTRFSREQKKTAASRVLSEAVNHSDAIALSGAELPFLSSEDARVFSLLQGTGDAPALLAGADRHDLAILGQWVLTLLDVLDQLSRHQVAGRPPGRRGRDIAAFLASDAHAEFTGWLHDLKNQAARQQANVRRVGVDELLDPINTWYEGRNLFNQVMPEGRLEQTCYVASLLLAAIAFHYQGLDVWGLSGLSVSLLPLSRNILQDIGLVSAKYRGPKWPFLYAFGESPNTRDIEVVAEWVAEHRAELEEGVRSIL